MRLSKSCMAAVRRAIRIARRFGAAALLPEHFIAGMLEGKNSATRFLARMGVPIQKLAEAWQAEIKTPPATPKPRKLKKAFEWDIVARHAERQALTCRCASVNSFHVLKGFLDIDYRFEDLLESFGVTIKMIKQFFADFTTKADRYAIGAGIA